MRGETRRAWWGYAAQVLVWVACRVPRIKEPGSHMAPRPYSPRLARNASILYNGFVQR